MQDPERIRLLVRVPGNAGDERANAGVRWEAYVGVSRSDRAKELAVESSPPTVTRDGCESVVFRPFDTETAVGAPRDIFDAACARLESSN